MINIGNYSGFAAVCGADIFNKIAVIARHHQIYCAAAKSAAMHVCVCVGMGVCVCVSMCVCVCVWKKGAGKVRSSNDNE